MPNPFRQPGEQDEIERNQRELPHTVRDFLLNSVTTQNSPAEKLAQVAFPDFKSTNQAGIYADNPDMMALAMQVAAPIAFHGSPHVFDKFSMQKIGTGEGAQAYGHGLYFTSEPKVAEGYRARLTPSPGEQPSWMPDLVWTKVRADVASGADLPTAIAKSRDYFKTLADEFKPGGENSHLAGSTVAKIYGEANEAAQKMEPAHFHGGTSGSFHQVDIPDNLLDWDKPVSEQLPDVLSSLRKAGIVAQDENGTWTAPAVGGRADIRDASGQDLYLGLMNSARAPDGKVAATNALRSAGIPGHSYVGDSSGVRNFVMYDDASIKPLARASSLAEWLKSQGTK